ncbi:hypothetical protein CHH59_20655 [Shouchella clausii]|nr:hypothetical protein CHH59_20655 [Shouchella clausii]
MFRRVRLTALKKIGTAVDPSFSFRMASSIETAVRSGMGIAQYQRVFRSIKVARQPLLFP